MNRLLATFFLLEEMSPFIQHGAPKLKKGRLVVYNFTPFDYHALRERQYAQP